MLTDIRSHISCFHECMSQWGNSLSAQPVFLLSSFPCDMSTVQMMNAHNKHQQHRNNPCNPIPQASDCSKQQVSRLFVCFLIYLFLVFFLFGGGVLLKFKWMMSVRVDTPNMVILGTGLWLWAQRPHPHAVCVCEGQPI